MLDRSVSGFLAMLAAVCLGWAMHAQAASPDDAIMLAMTALMCILPLRQVGHQAGWTCARSPTLLAFVVLLLGWAAYATSRRT